MIPEQWCPSFQHQPFISWIIEPTLSVDRKKNILKAATPNHFLGSLTFLHVSRLLGLEWFYLSCVPVFAAQHRYC